MVYQSQLQTPAYVMVLAKGHGLLIKQAYLSTISLLKSAEFLCCLFAHENIEWPTAANWIIVGYIVGYIVVVNRCLTEPGCLTNKTPGIGCLSHTQTYTHQRKCHMPLSNTNNCISCPTLSTCSASSSVSI